MKWTKERLIEEIKDDLIIYLKSGRVNINSYLKIQDLNIENLDQLLKIHFLLLNDLEAYTKKINKNLKKLNKEKLVRGHGEIKGNILWSKTIEERYNKNEKEIFIYSRKEASHNNSKVKILKELFEVIYELSNEKSIMKIVRNYKEIELNYINEFYKKNLSKRKLAKATEKEINMVIKDRDEFYKNAAILLRRYRSIVSLDQNEIEKLLGSTFIELINESTLFELYWVFKIIKRYTVLKKLYLLDYNNTKVAEWEREGKIYTIFHNSSGSEDVEFKVGIEKIENTDNWYLNKQLKVIENTNKKIQELYPDKKERYKYIYNGRPDILLEIRNKQSMELEKIEIYEVKYTERIEYIIEGIKQLEEYKAFINTKTKTKARVKGYICFINNEISL